MGTCRLVAKQVLELSELVLLRLFGTDLGGGRLGLGRSLGGTLVANAGEELVDVEFIVGGLGIGLGLLGSHAGRQQRWARLSRDGVRPDGDGGNA